MQAKPAPPRLTPEQFASLLDSAKQRAMTLRQQEFDQLWQRLLQALRHARQAPAHRPCPRRTRPSQG